MNKNSFIKFPELIIVHKLKVEGLIQITVL